MSDASNAIFSSIRDAADVNIADLRTGSALSRSWLGWVPLSPVFISFPQLMQVILSPRRTWTPLHLWHGSLVSVPPFARRDAPLLILLTTLLLLLSSSEEAMIEYLLLTNFFFVVHFLSNLLYLSHFVVPIASAKWAS
jgi:hypothetical protein